MGFDKDHAQVHSVIQEKEENLGTCDHYLLIPFGLPSHIMSSNSLSPVQSGNPRFDYLHVIQIFRQVDRRKSSAFCCELYCREYVSLECVHISLRPKTTIQKHVR